MIDEYQPHRYIKRPIAITAQRMRESFSIMTREGTMTGRPGDYLVTGVMGEPYVIAADIFQQTYMTEADYLAQPPSVQTRSSRGRYSYGAWEIFEGYPED